MLHAAVFPSTHMDIDTATEYTPGCSCIFLLQTPRAVIYERMTKEGKMVVLTLELGQELVFIQQQEELPYTRITHTSAASKVTLKPRQQPVFYLQV
jgi:hypothetical protein